MKKSKSLSSIWWVIKLKWRTSKSFICWNIVYSLYNGISSILYVYVGAKLLASVTAVALQNGPSRPVYQWLVILFALEVLGSVLNTVTGIIERRFQQKIEVAVTEQFFAKLYSLSQEQFDNQAFHTKIDRAQDALNQVWRVLNELSWAVSSLVKFFGAVGAILVAAPLIGVLIIITILPVSVIRMRQNRTREKMYKAIEPYERVAYRSRWILIDPELMPEVRLMNGFKQLLKSWRTNMNKTHDMIYANDKQQLPADVAIEVVEPAISFAASFYFFRLLVAGSIGLDRFIFLRGLIEQASAAATSITSSFDQLHSLSINLRSFTDVNDTPPAIPNGSVTVKAPLTIDFKDVSFAYPGTSQLVLQDISFLIVPGSKLALVGENGAGKTTLLKLLLRQYLPSSGSITVNGTPIQDIEQSSYYQALSNLSQEFLIVNHLTIKDNLLLGNDRGVTAKEIDESLILVGAQKFINKLPHNLDQRLDSSFDDGTGLSGGQTQRIGIARTLLHDGDVLILDEPTSAIDAKAEYEIFNNIYKAHGDKTTLIVSHRFSTVRKADKIIVMEAGKITEYGSHEELLKHGGLYKEMFEAQAEGYR